MATITFETKKEKIRFKTFFPMICPKCGWLTEYSEKYDSWFCPVCNIWTEAKCSNPDCEYCRKRPARPIMKKD